MDNIIEKLVEIENVSSSILEAANNQKKLLDEDQEKRIQEYDRAKDLETDTEIENIRRQLAHAADEELEALRNSSQERLARIDNDYAANHEALAQRIFDEIVRK